MPTKVDVLIVGGGPAGSSCAWALRNSGLEVAIVDKQMFPRDKVCGGWITPPAVQALELDVAEYARGRVLQPITNFITGCIGGQAPCETDFGKPVSYGIRRREFDEFLLRRAGAGKQTHIFEGVALSSLERAPISRDGGWWIANDNLMARMVVGAGGRFCPVARQLTAQTRHLPGKAEAPVVAQETEFELDAGQQKECRVHPTRPELYFCADMKGYGWCFRKGDFLNVGLGRADSKSLPEHVSGFVTFLHQRGAIPADIPAMRGHAYLLHGTSPRTLSGDGFLLIGDAAGLAWPQSGEGILPAIESGLLAAETILAAHGDYSNANLEPYRTRLARKIGTVSSDWTTALGSRLPAGLVQMAARRLTETRWFAREFILRRWFLHA